MRHPPLRLDDWIIALSRKFGLDAVRACYTLFRGPVQRAVKDRIITDPCIQVPLPKKPPRKKTFDDVLTAAQVDALVANLIDPTGGYLGLKTNHRYTALMFMSAGSARAGTRPSACGPATSTPRGSRSRSARIVINQIGARTFPEKFNKTEDFRTVPCPPPVMNALMEHVERYCPGTGREDFLFLTRNHTHPLRTNFARAVLHKAATRAQLPTHVTWLTLRHTGASLMFDAGLTLFEVQQRLGHKSPVITAEIYTHLMRERFEEGGRSWSSTWSRCGTVTRPRRFEPAVVHRPAAQRPRCAVSAPEQPREQERDQCLRAMSIMVFLSTILTRRRGPGWPSLQVTGPKASPSAFSWESRRYQPSQVV